MSREKLLFVVQKGCLVPADNLTSMRLREKGYNIGDHIHAVLSKARNPGFHRLAHALGMLVSENIEAFSGMDSHTVLKRLQWESGVGCTEMGVNMKGVGFVPVRQPKSLAYSAMDEGEFKEVMRGLSRHIAKEYWPTLDAEQIQDMASCMVDEL